MKCMLSYFCLSKTQVVCNYSSKHITIFFFLCDFWLLAQTSPIRQKQLFASLYQFVSDSSTERVYFSVETNFGQRARMRVQVDLARTPFLFDVPSGLYMRYFFVIANRLNDRSCVTGRRTKHAGHAVAQHLAHLKNTQPLFGQRTRIFVRKF